MSETDEELHCAFHTEVKDGKPVMCVRAAHTVKTVKAKGRDGVAEITVCEKHSKELLEIVP